MDADIVIPELAAVALFYLLLPSAVIAASRARRETVCPDNKQFAAVRVDRKQSVLRMFNGRAHRIADCSRWPDMAGCDQACVGALS